MNKLETIIAFAASMETEYTAEQLGRKIYEVTGDNLTYVGSYLSNLHKEGKIDKVGRIKKRSTAPIVWKNKPEFYKPLQNEKVDPLQAWKEVWSDLFNVAPLPKKKLIKINRVEM